MISIILFLFVQSTLSHSILLVPGLGASILQNEKTYLWINYEYLNYNIENYLSGNLSNYYVYDNSKIYVNKQDDGLFGISVIDPYDWLGYTYYYYYLIKYLKKAGHDIYGFPYDWRQIPIHSKDIDYIIKKYNITHIISHSMGGYLVANYILEYNSNLTWISISTPWNGVEGEIIEAYYHGYNFGIKESYFGGLNYNISRLMVNNSASLPFLLKDKYSVFINKLYYDESNYTLFYGNHEIHKVYKYSRNIKYQWNKIKNNNIYIIYGCNILTKNNFSVKDNKIEWNYKKGDGTITCSNVIPSFNFRKKWEYKGKGDHTSILWDYTLFEYITQLL